MGLLIPGTSRVSSNSSGDGGSNKSYRCRIPRSMGRRHSTVTAVSEVSEVSVETLPVIWKLNGLCFLRATH
jgi:hypothetical protein